jgi:putative ABC transport system permease protein
MKNATMRDVWEGIRTQPGRAGLSFLAVGIGIIALTILLAVTGGLREKARLMVRELGAQVVAIVPPDIGTRDAGASLTRRHAKLLAAGLDGRMVSFIRRAPVKPEGWAQSVSVVVTDHALADVRQWRIVDGRFLDRTDVEQIQRHAVITSALGARANWSVGSAILLQGMPFTVVGVLETAAGAAESDSPDARLQIGDLAVFVPCSVAAPWLSGSEDDGRAVDAVFVLGREDETMDHLVSVCRNLLAAPDATVSGTSWITPETLLRGIRHMQRTIRLSVGSVAALCLILGGTTLMSLMLANVRDRVSEIGLRRALGARARDVSSLFVIEACAITLAAALAGTAAAWLLLTGAGARLPVPLRLDAWTFLIPVLASVGLGAIFSYWPARIASRIAPADALRNE